MNKTSRRKCLQDVFLENINVRTKECVFSSQRISHWCVVHFTAVRFKLKSTVTSDRNVKTARPIGLDRLMPVRLLESPLSLFLLRLLGQNYTRGKLYRDGWSEIWSHRSDPLYKTLWVDFQRHHTPNFQIRRAVDGTGVQAQPKRRYRCHLPEWSLLILTILPAWFGDFGFRSGFFKTPLMLSMFSISRKKITRESGDEKSDVVQ